MKPSEIRLIPEKVWNRKTDSTEETCSTSKYSYSKTKLTEETHKLGRVLKQDLRLEIADLDEAGSKFFKASYFNPHRLGPTVKESDVEQFIAE